QERNGVIPQSKALTPEQQKIQELEARIARLEREKSVLKRTPRSCYYDHCLRRRAPPPPPKKHGFVYELFRQNRSAADSCSIVS
ncbi:ISPsy24, transposase orfA, partial [Pseudomonas amygdali pv. eriobotryae]